MDAITSDAVAELAAIQAHKAELTEREDVLKAHLRNLPAGTYSDAHGTPVLRITVPQVFDAEAAAQTLSSRDRKRCEKITYDGKRVRALIDDTAPFEHDGTVRVSVLDGASASASVTDLTQQAV